mmetsp:Transcript_38557/g.43432  ORF Transcript_38557/g.43432 Transcript_38557/m.43432 type:complete len:436 (-) Transcript_38557:138-1445(-)
MIFPSSRLFTVVDCVRVLFLLAVVLTMIVVVDGAADTPDSNSKKKELCVNDHGVFIGLATDEDAYTSIPGSKGTEVDAIRQSWIVTSTAAGEEGPKNSYAEQFLQVLPDTGRTYPTSKKAASDNGGGGGGGGHSHSHGGHHDLTDVNELEGDSPYVAFQFKVTKDTKHTISEGIHTLFIRWTGGDTVGGGDSFFAVLYKLPNNKKHSKVLIHGQQTVKPAVVPIDAGMSKFAGCCYDMVTHACPCYSVEPTSNVTCPYFIERSKASDYGIQCVVGGGAMVIIKAPQWYLFAGQDNGDVMDFDSEPWDVTCEADGSNTRDSGHDFPSWVLDHGTYQLRVYAREDGTALDGIYLAGPNGDAPLISKRYTKGDSSFCVEQAFYQSIWFVSSISVTIVLLCVGSIGYYIMNYTDGAGKEILNSVLTKPAQAVRYVYVES